MSYSKYAKLRKYMDGIAQNEWKKGRLIASGLAECEGGQYNPPSPGDITRWVTISGQYVCDGTSKYTKEKEQTSTDGTNWTDTGNTRTGSLIETSSSSCASTRWVADTGYVCVGYDKKNKEKEQISYDSGSTWTDTGATRAGSTLIEQNSEDCTSMKYERIVDPLGMKVSTAPCEDVSLWPADDYYETDSLVHQVVNYEDNGIRYNIYTHHHFTTTGDSQIIRYNNPENGDCFKVTVFQDSGSYASTKRTVRQELIGHVCVADNNDVLFFKGYSQKNKENLKADFECEPTMNPSSYYQKAHFYNFSKDIDIKLKPTNYMLWKLDVTSGHTFDLYYREKVGSDNFTYQFTIDSTDMSVYNKFQSN